MKISVVTVCYNSVDTIEETMLSVLNQTYPDVEYIIIDGGSTDGTVDIIKKYSDKLSYWISEPDKGIYDAMNKGIAVATGDYINFMNAGDKFIEDNIIVNILKQHYDEKILYGNIIRCYGSYKERNAGVCHSNPKIIDFIGDTIHHQAAFIKRDLFDKYGYYSTEYKLMSDWKFFFEVAVLSHERIKYVNLDIAYFMMDGASSNNPELYSNECKAYLDEQFGKELREYLLELRDYRNNELSSFFRRIKNILRKHKRIFKVLSRMKIMIKNPYYRQKKFNNQ